MSRFRPYRKYALVVLMFAYNCLVYWGSRAVTMNKPHYNIELGFEHFIPLVPWTVYIYVGCYVFWAVNSLLAVRGSEREAYRFVFGEMLGKTVCLGFFLFFPTTMDRPEIVGNSLSEIVLKGLYALDTPDNLLPSIHCMLSWMCFLGVRGKEWIPRWYQGVSCMIALAICISTLTVKQHVILDVFTGILLAEIFYRFMGWYLAVRARRHLQVPRDSACGTPE